MVSIINIVSSKQNSLYQGLSIKHTSKNKKRTYHLKKKQKQRQKNKNPPKLQFCSVTYFLSSLPLKIECLPFIWFVYT